MKVELDQNKNLLAISKSLNPDKVDGEFIGIAKFKYSFVKNINRISEAFKTGF